MKLLESAHKAFTDHALAEYPREACGLIINSAYIPCENVHPEPNKHFRIQPQRLIREQERGRLEAILHSHPYCSGTKQPAGYKPEFPSASDIAGFNDSGVPWGIASTDGGGLSEMVWLDDNERPPINGRYFIWGVQDCYSLVRDWFKLNKNIDLVNVPREWGWWNQAENRDLFESWFARVGFHVIPAKDATIGDVALMRMPGYGPHSLGVINHCGVITNHNELTHQGSDPFYSRQCRLDLWQKSVAKFIRYGLH